MEIKMTIDDREINRLLRRLRRKMGDLTPVMEEIGELIVSSVQENFNRGGRYSKPGSWRGGNKKWKELAPSTIKERKRLGYYDKDTDSCEILVRTGELKDSITYDAGKDYVTVGTDKVYAAIHQFGGKAGRKHAAKIPARPFLVVQDDDLEEIKEIILDYIKEFSK